MTTDHITYQNTPEFTLAADPARAMQEMMDTMDELRAIYIEENAVLDKADADGFMALQDRKIALARRYQAGTTQLAGRKEEIRGVVTPALRDEVTRKQEEFSRIAADNLAALERMRKGTRRLSERLMDAARDTARKDQARYGARGHLEEQERRVSIGLNESA